MKSCFFRLLIPPLLTQLKCACPSARLDKKKQFIHLGSKSVQDIVTSGSLENKKTRQFYDDNTFIRVLINSK